jgi:hypothetical protein
VGRRLGSDQIVDGTAGLEDDSASDLDGVVGETFLVAAEQGDINRGGDAVFPCWVHQQTKQLTVQVVHSIIIAIQLRGHACITVTAWALL